MPEMDERPQRVAVQTLSDGFGFGKMRDGAIGQPGRISRNRRRQRR